MLGGVFFITLQVAFRENKDLPVTLTAGPCGLYCFNKSASSLLLTGRAGRP